MAAQQFPYGPPDLPGSRCPPQNLRQLRMDLQRLVGDLQSGERACCRNTSGERLRQALSRADERLVKQVCWGWGVSC